MASLKNPLLTFATVAELTGGTWITEPSNLDQTLVGGAFDSRKTGDAEIFFTLQGARDAHDFLPNLKGSGVKLALVTKDTPAIEGVALLKVEDGLTSLQDLARHQAKVFKGKTIAITGSSGKTTAKAWLSSLATLFQGAKQPREFQQPHRLPRDYLEPRGKDRDFNLGNGNQWRRRIGLA